MMRYSHINLPRPFDDADWGRFWIEVGITWLPHVPQDIDWHNPVQQTINYFDPRFYHSAGCRICFRKFWHKKKCREFIKWVTLIKLREENENRERNLQVPCVKVELWKR